MTLIYTSEVTVETVTTEAIRTYLQGASLKITIRYLCAQNSGTEISVGVLIESGEHCEQKNLIVTAEQYSEWKLCRGEISEETYEMLEEATLFCKALRSGEHLLAYGANTKQMLARKLTQKGFSRDIANRAVERLCQIGLLDEEKDLQREVEKCLRKLWGSKRISSHLWSKGFAAEVMELLPSILEKVNFFENCASLIRKHYGDIPKEPSEQKRMIASLSRYGYSLSEIKNAFQLLS